MPIEERPLVRLVSESGGVIGGCLLDLSMTGAMVECSETFGAEEVCVMSIMVDNDTTIEMRGTVVRVHPKVLGVLFTGISGASYGALHELLLDNAKDEDSVREEIFGHPHLTPDIY